ncbi:hypothetical protein [Rhodococcus pyridinivorans]|uniref:Uncharacterized protein n=1 Tax=Rhodococcus pyridinivorans TaxID=103816 RepID=A0A7M2XPI2_9NOCA|nr:hypothetical protein [Rhodococcus pyridinivorans]QOV99527.1 hypothetical protein INP59_03755 [Rhodococcus pyridinivorans]
MSERHPATNHLLSQFAYGHLPEHLMNISRMASGLAVQMIEQLDDGPELTAGLRKLLEAKDCFVRQAVIDHRSSEAAR